MKRRQVQVILAAALLGLSGLTACGAAASGETASMSGIYMTPQEFKENFSGEPEERDPNGLLALAQKKADVSITDVNIGEEQVHMQVRLSADGEEVQLPIEGTLCSGYKADHGVNSTIIVVPEAVEGYQILLFEIYDDTVDENLLLTSVLEEEISASAHVKLYMQDEQETVYLFETDLPECFRGLAADHYPEAPKEKDALWAVPLVEIKTNFGE